MKEIDARGLDCPKPVIETKQALEGNQEVMVILDNKIAVENVTRLAKKMDCKISSLEEDGEFKLYLTKEDLKENESIEKGKVYFITSKNLGEGEIELSQFLIKGFINTLLEIKPRPAKVIFINSGVKLPTETPEVVKDLKRLAEAGVDILSCGACLDYYDLSDKLEVGRVSNMYEIVDTLNSYQVVKV